MAHRIVDVLETVEIDEQQRQHGLAAAGIVDRVLCALAKQEAIGQTGQRVVVRKLLDALARLVLVGDVLNKPADSMRYFVFVFQFRSTSEKRRLGKEGVRTCRARGAPAHKKK